MDRFGDCPLHDAAKHLVQVTARIALDDVRPHEQNQEHLRQPRLASERKPMAAKQMSIKTLSAHSAPYIKLLLAGSKKLECVSFPPVSMGWQQMLRQTGIAIAQPRERNSRFKRHTLWNLPKYLRAVVRFECGMPNFNTEED
jgi:hypothetical protein